MRDGQDVVVDIQAYKAEPPRSGDIVAFEMPGTGQQTVRRVIGVPGDGLRIAAGSIYLNYVLVPEPYLPEMWTFNNSWPPDGTTITIPPHTFFVLGDNRNHSVDSRVFGLIDSRFIIGKVR
jgi:signal peptidase I